MRKKVALITGAAQGIGRETALKLAEEGIDLAVVDIKAEQLESLKKEVKPEVDFLTLETDVSDSEQVDEAVERTMDKFGRIDILVNNAGILTRGSIEEVSDEDLEEVMSINFDGAFYFSRSVAPYMKKQGYGKIVNVSSITAKAGDHSTTPCYGASKGALSTLTKSLARELGPHGVNVNGVAPHAIMTPLMDYWDEEKKERIRESLPVKRLGTPEDVANLIKFLVSEESEFITGQVININGGEYME